MSFRTKLKPFCGKKAFIPLPSKAKYGFEGFTDMGLKNIELKKCSASAFEVGALIL